MRGGRLSLLSGTRPWPAKGAAFDFDPRKGRAYWRGVTTLDGCLINTNGNTVNATAPRGDGRWSLFAPNTLRWTRRGIFHEQSAQNRCLQNFDMTNAKWVASNLTVANNLSTPFSPSIDVLNIRVLTAGTASWVVPADWNNVSNAIYCFGPGGNGADAVTNTRGGGGGGGGACARRTNVTLTPGATVVTSIPAGGAQAATTWDGAGDAAKAISADYGRNSASATGGAQGTGAACVPTSGAKAGGIGRNGSSGTNNRSGAGGGSCGGIAFAGQGGGAGGNVSGGGGGGAPTAAGIGSEGESSAEGGDGGNNGDGVGGGAVGAAGTAAGAGTLGGGGGGGVSATGINGGAGGSYSELLFADASTGEDIGAATGPGGGGGGGGFAGNGGAGGLGAGGGGGGSTNAAAGTGGAGGAGFIVIVWGGSAASRLTATANNATLLQTINVGGVSAERIFSALVYKIPGAPLTGAVYLTQNNFSDQEDVSSLLRDGEWVQCPMSDSVTTDVNPVVGIKLANSSDAVGFCLAQLENGALVTTPVPTQASVATRRADYITFNLTAARLADIRTDDLAILMECEPGDPSGGWSGIDIGNDVPSLAVFDGYIVDDELTVTAVTSGTIEIGQRINVGTGVVSFTDISELGTGSGGVGTYVVSVEQTTAGAPGASISMTTRAKIREGYRGNATIKEDLSQQIGFTAFKESTGLNIGFDPQTAEYGYGQNNVFGLTARAAARLGRVALKGDVAECAVQASWPDPSVFDVVSLGGQWPNGAQSVNGPIGRVIGIPRRFLSAGEMAKATLPPVLP